ncbi:hypothetical protein ACG2OD_14030 [Streptomyces sp. PDY-4]|uniref:Lipoprotein n=1 Tax=Streptomyces fungicidicus TaxID=68203 RepID=A0A494USN5_9ACTN|nr:MULTISPECIES: hypothetical protein [Streptomyces]AYL37863.1 hypothetical protein CNQ36_22120 [Streptomyces fungicidicus]QKW02249.1 hypothetical protein HUT14_21495 [Streptomyces sp. NA02536]TQL20581.1 hypothetical protein FBY37_2538 [Streptomyces sp. SLBN-134]
MKARRTGTRRTAVRRAPALLTVGMLGTLLAGCGIRATEVPTDFGPAPSRVSCSQTGPEVSTQAQRGLPVRVFLLCGSSLVAVDRTVRVPEGAADSRRALVAQGLLDELSQQPPAAEQQAGYATRVPDGTTVSGPRSGDPDDTLRLSAAPGSLTSAGLAQIVCTFSDSAAAEGDGSVILGGPDDTRPRRYRCTDEVRSRPDDEEPPSSEVTGG